MILGALVDAGLDLAALENELKKLGLDGYELAAEPVKRHGIGGTKLNARTVSHSHARRHLSDIRAMIGGSSLSEPVKSGALAVFVRLAEAEARVHRVSAEEIHFHEVGALDAIIDIVGAAAGIELLGIDEVHCSRLTTGYGHVDCAHGRLPVPAPATAELIRGFPSQAGDVERELLTPTGAAILTTLSRSFGPRPCFRVTSTGYGAGALDLESQPNLLRVFLGEDGAGPEQDQVWVVETNLDDMPAQAIGFVSERLFQAGALDVFCAPVQMKKSRPAVLLTVIVDLEHLEAVETLLLEETTTFGVRRALADRRKLAREVVAVETAHGTVRVKLGRMGGRLVKASPEYEDCRRIAEETGLPFNRVYDLAAREAGRLLDRGKP
jgi:uncharacterized protein (TIGR00299 family) protein